MIGWPEVVAIMGLGSIVCEYLWRVRMERQTMIRAAGLAERVDELEKRLNNVPALVREIVSVLVPTEPPRGRAPK